MAFIDGAVGVEPCTGLRGHRLSVDLVQDAGVGIADQVAVQLGQICVEV